MTHRIGNCSSYDGDIELIESFVKFANNPKDEMLSLELRAYYTSRAISYWQKLKEFLVQEGSEAYEGDSDHIGYDQNIILDNIQNYKKKFFEIIEDLSYDFSIIKVIKLFIYIGTLSCFNSDISTYEKLYNKNVINYKDEIDFNRVFPLVNDNGAFSLNTWLYSFFEGIDLVGFTSKESYFDGIIGCSLDMYNHDISHLVESVLIKKYSNEFYEQKRIYYNILNSNLTMTEKELYILVLWIILHEYVDAVNFSDPIEKTMKTFIFWSYEDLAGKYSISEFEKYSHILLSENNIKDSFYYFENYTFTGKTVPKKTYNLDFANFIDSIDNHRESLIDYHYMFLGLVYVLKNIKENYSFYTSDIEFY